MPSLFITEAFAYPREQTMSHRYETPSGAPSSTNLVNSAFTFAPSAHYAITDVATKPTPSYNLNLRTTPKPTNTFNMMRSAMRPREDDWMSQQEQKVKISGIQKSVTTRDVYKQLARYGTILRIELSADRAFVVFQPPPHYDIYRKSINIGEVRVRVEECCSRRFPVKSPVNPARLYQESNILLASAIDFGITLAEKSLHIMRSLRSPRVQVALNLGDRKELDVQFPFQIDEAIRKLRFRLPLSLVGLVYKISNHSTGGCDLIIPFDSPPQFFMQAKDISMTCDVKERKWIDWQSWYRQTDIIDNASWDRLQRIPVMNHKGVVIIDIGKFH
jgi:RNA-dependent RNA polymerase